MRVINPFPRLVLAPGSGVIGWSGALEKATNKKTSGLYIRLRCGVGCAWLIRRSSMGLALRKN